MGTDPIQLPRHLARHHRAACRGSFWDKATGRMDPPNPIHCTEANGGNKGLNVRGSAGLRPADLDPFTGARGERRAKATNPFELGSLEPLRGHFSEPNRFSRKEAQIGSAETKAMVAHVPSGSDIRQHTNHTKMREPWVFFRGFRVFRGQNGLGRILAEMSVSARQQCKRRKECATPGSLVHLAPLRG